MGSEWQKVRLGDLISIKHGWPFKSEHFSEERGGRPIVVNIGNFRYSGGFRFDETTVKEYTDSYPAEYETRVGDILLVMTCQTAGGEILGIPARVPDDGHTYLHNQRLGRVVIKDSERVDEGYLYWLFLWSEFNRELVASATGTKILHTAPSRIEAFKFYLPTLAEQFAIAQILSALDDKIELNRKMSATLEQMGQSLFKSWFVDFDPVKAKATGQALENIDSEIAALFPSEFEESQLGLIPRGWKLSTIGEEVRVLGGTTPNTKEPLYWEGGIHRWVTPRDLSKLSDKVLLDTDRKITDAGLQQISSGQLPMGTVLLSSRAPIGYLVLAQIPVSINQGFIAMVCDKQLSPNFVLQWAEHSMDKIKARGSGTTFAEINKANFRPIPVIVPPVEIIRRFDGFVTPLYQQITEKVKENTTLSQLRDELLPKLISGKLRFADMEE